MISFTKKMLCLFLAAILLVGVFPATALAAENTNFNVEITVNLDGTEKAKETIQVANSGTLSVTVDDALVQARFSGYDTHSMKINDWTVDGVATTNPTVQITKDNMKIVVNLVSANQEFTLTLDANGGKFSNGMDTMSKKVYTGKQVGETLETPVRDGFTFSHWEIDGVQVEVGTYTNWNKNVTAKAVWTEKTTKLIVKRVLDGNLDGATTIFEQDVPVGKNLLDYLKANVTATVNSVLNAGYEWDTYWYDYTTKDILNTQKDTTDEAQTVYVKFNAKQYNLYFNVSDGSVDPTSKKVTFNKKVGDLPTPTNANGKVFMNWIDENGRVYTEDTIYKVAGDTTLTAVWKDEAFVMLRIYLNGNTKSCDRIVDMTSYVENDNVTRDAAKKIVDKYYTAKSGEEMRLVGLFTDATWAEYKNDTSKGGTHTVQIRKDEPTYVYVMVKGAANKADAGTGDDTTSPTQKPKPTTKPADPTNPKTGDESNVIVASTILLASVSALVLFVIDQKKRRI